MPDVIGLMPAAGSGLRLFGDGGCKELLPVGFAERPAGTARVVSDYLLDAMAVAGVQRVIVVTTPDKTAIMRHHLHGRSLGLRLLYLVGRPPSMVHALDLAHEWTRDFDTVVFGMPDTVLLPRTCIGQLLRQHISHGAALSLGMFSTTEPSRFGMVSTDPDGCLTYHEDKPERTVATTMWGLAAWNQRFTRLLHDHVGQSGSGTEKEVVFGDVIDAARVNGLLCKGFLIDGGRYYDVGSYDSFRQAVLEV